MIMLIIEKLCMDGSLFQSIGAAYQKDRFEIFSLDVITGRGRIK